VGIELRHDRSLPAPEDEALLREPTVAAVWQLLREHFSGRQLDLDTDLALDLNLDSFGWMQLSILLQKRLGVALSETDLARIGTMRDLLKLSIERRPEACEPPRGRAGTPLGDPHSRNDSIVPSPPG
jgi:acyl carrier protein